MKVIRLAGTFLLPFILISLAVYAATPAPVPVVLQQSEQNAIQLTFTSGSWHISNDKETSQMPLLTHDPDTLPSHAVLLGVPTPSVSLTIHSTQSQLVPLTDLQQVGSADSLVTLESNIQLRDQHAARVTFNPIQQEGEGVQLLEKRELQQSQTIALNTW